VEWCQGGGIAERIIILDAEYLLDKNYIIWLWNTTGHLLVIQSVVRVMQRSWQGSAGRGKVGSGVLCLDNMITIMWSSSSSVVVVVWHLWKSCFLLCHYKYILATTAKFLRHENNIYHAKVHTWITRPSHIKKNMTVHWGIFFHINFIGIIHHEQFQRYEYAHFFNIV